MSDERKLRAAAIVVMDAASAYLGGETTAHELDQAVELWLLEREKASKT